MKENRFFASLRMTKGVLRMTKGMLRMTVALIVVLASGLSAFAASTFTVAIQSGSTFRITRTGNTSVSETIDWRVVSLSAIAGVHFTGYNGNYYGTVTFNVNDTYKDVTISESTPGDNAYKYQNGTSRSYRFEVLDRNGDILASCDRSKTTGTSVPSSGLFSQKTGTIQSSEFWIDDSGYKQTNSPHTINRSSFYTNNEQSYLSLLSSPLHMTLELQAKEEDDAYEYLQVLINNTTGCDSENDADKGNPGTPSLSRYMAGFEMHPSSTYDTYQTYTFPVADVADGTKATNPWGYGTNFPLSMQKFKSGYRSDDYKIIVPNSFNTITVRFDASGSKGSDKWWIQNLKAKLTAIDNAAPTVLNNYKVSGGRHQKGNTVYVSVPFSEIVKITGNTRKLTTSWGDLAYEAGDGTNVLTFKGEIGSSASGTLTITGMSGTIKDLADNSFSNPWSSNNKDLGTALDADYVWSASDFNTLADGSSEIATKTDLRHLALMVNVTKDPCTGITFSQTQDITCDNTYIPIGYYVSNSDMADFRGTYDGQGHTIRGITVSRTGSGEADSYVGLFGRVDRNNSTDYGTVRNVVLASSTFTGNYSVGGIVGYNYGGTVENCRVESTVTIKAGTNGVVGHGGIVGRNMYDNAKVIGCYSAAVISSNGKSNCYDCGGIVGYNYCGSIKDCLYTGTTVTSTNDKGAIVGYDQNGTGTFSNNYYTAIDLGGLAGTDQNGARQAHTITLGPSVTINGAQTAYSVSGLTAIGTIALSYNGTIYSGEGQEITLTYTSAPAGYEAPLLGYSLNGTPFEGSTFEMPASDATVTARWTVADFESGHAGTQADPYIIYNPGQLDQLASNVNSGTSYNGKYIRLGADIEYDGTDNNFTPIGNDDTNKFRGTFDGDGHTVSGIVLTENSDYRGLFGSLHSSGTVKNVTLSNSSISGYWYVGGIVGGNSGTVVSCVVKNSVTISTTRSDSYYHGGIVGRNFGIIQGCVSSATIGNNGKNGCRNYGSVAGANAAERTLENCLVIGSVVVSGTANAGAILSDNGGYLRHNYYYDCSVGGASSNVGCNEDSSIKNNMRYGDITTDDGAVQAVASVSKPAEIGAQIASYSNGLTVYEHGAHYNGTYYLRHDLVDTAVALILTQGTKDGATAYWGTFYNSTTNYELSEGAAAYTMGTDYKLYRLGTNGRKIPKGNAVVIIAASASASLTPTATAYATDHATGGNQLQGSDSAVAVSGLSGTPYVLSVSAGAIGFRQFSGASIPAGKAYYVVTP